MKRSFTIDSDEGLPIRGVIDMPEKPKAVVIVIHGFKGFKDWGFFPWLCEYLSEEGVAACRFDMSRNGIGDNPETFERLDLFADDTYSIQIADLHRVAEHLATIEEFADLSRFVVGHSRGGGVAILGASAIEGLEGVVTWSAIANANRWDADAKKKWREDGTSDIVNSRTGQIMKLSTAILDDFDENADRFNILEVAASLDVPLLLIHGGSDETVPVEEAERIDDSARNSSLVVIRSATHTMNAIHPLVTVPIQLKLAASLTSSFIATRG